MLRAHLGRANYITSRARWLLAGAADDAAASVPSGASGREKQFKFAANELGKYLLAIILAPGTGAARLTCVCVPETHNEVAQYSSCAMAAACLSLRRAAGSWRRMSNSSSRLWPIVQRCATP